MISNFTSFFCKIAAALLLAASTLLLSTTAHALAMASGEVSAELRITSVPVSLAPISGGAAVFDQFEDSSGSGVSSIASTAAAEAADPNDFMVGDGLLLDSQSSASALPVGAAEAFVFTDGFLDIFNPTASNLSIDLGLTYSLFASALVDDPLSELAFSSAIVALLLFDSSGDFLAELFSDSLFFDTGQAIGGSGTAAIGPTLYTHSLSVAPGEGLSLLLTADSDAFSTSEGGPVAAPLPGTILLFLAAFAALFVSAAVAARKEN